MEDSVGKTVKMEGRVSGSQPMTVSWYKDRREIFSTDKYDISFKNNTAVLCVKASAASDSGMYSCEATNEAGKAACQVALTITGVCVWMTWPAYWLKENRREITQKWKGT